MAARPLAISTELSSRELRRRARNEPNRRAAMRMLAIANALDGMHRRQAARLADMSDQALCDAVKRYNTEGIEGLFDRPKTGRPRHLDAGQESELIEIVINGPDVEKDGLSSFTRDDLVKVVHEKWQVSYHPGSMGRALRRLGLSRQKARPSNPRKDPDAAAAFKKRVSNIKRNCRYT
jgi:transposase